VPEESAPRIEIDSDPTREVDLRPSRGQTTPHASAEWMAGFDEGRSRGAADILGALEGSLVAVGVGPDVAKVIVARVRARAERQLK
jgi:hypothetical protein